MPAPIYIHWFEQDLRLADNPALSAAAANGTVLPIYILDDANAGDQSMGGASRWWLHHSLSALNTALGGSLQLYQGDARAVLAELCSRFNVAGVYWNRRYESWRISRDSAIKQQLQTQGIAATSYNGALLQEPWQLLKQDGTPYKVFTPYYRQACLRYQHQTPLTPIASNTSLAHDDHALTIEDLKLLPNIGWDKHFYDTWAPGEQGAQQALHQFLDGNLQHYQEGRDYPAISAVSRLSPHLHFGELSPRQIMQALLTVPDDNNREHFIRELRWREFSYYLLYHWPSLPTNNFKPAFDRFKWANNPTDIKRWQHGQTGYPLVDAGMRELWQTGFMHNRVRMICASFLIKNLLCDWRIGATWFWDCLVDADLASNSASWQWVAGSGTDAAPYFRIFNPSSQGEKFDPDGLYTQRFVPELKDLPQKYLFQPWLAPPEVLAQANITLGETYPLPMVDIKTSRQRALDAYANTKT